MAVSGLVILVGGVLLVGAIIAIVALVLAERRRQ
jgi:hypothetical protein